MSLVSFVSRARPSQGPGALLLTSPSSRDLSGTVSLDSGDEFLSLSSGGFTSDDLSPRFRDEIYSSASSRLGTSETPSRNINSSESVRIWAQDSAATLFEVATQLGPTIMTALAREVALSTLDPEIEATANRKALHSVRHQDVSIDQRVDEAWRHIEPKLTTAIKPPVVTSEDQISFGGTSGTQVVMNLPPGVSEDEAWFITAHEVAHAELKHWFQKKALDRVERWFGNGGAAVSESFRAARRDLEYEADRRAVEMVGAKITEPKKVLLSLMSTTAGQDHPAGLARAESARKAFADQGVTVSESDWAEILTLTKETRESQERREAKEESIDWGKFQ